MGPVFKLLRNSILALGWGGLLLSQGVESSHAVMTSPQISSKISLSAFCDSIHINSKNLIGILAYAQDLEVEKVKVIYTVQRNQPGGLLFEQPIEQRQTELILLRKDAQALRSQVKSLLSKKSSLALPNEAERSEVGEILRIQAERLPNGECFNYWVDEAISIKEE